MIVRINVKVFGGEKFDDIKSTFNKHPSEGLNFPGDTMYVRVPYLDDSLSKPPMSRFTQNYYYRLAVFSCPSLSKIIVFMLCSHSLPTLLSLWSTEISSNY